MKIIFDSEKEKQQFYNDNCPGDVGLMENHNIYCSDCSQCWEQSGLDYEIKNEESIEMLTYTDYVYELVKKNCKDMDSIYEDYIIKIVGHYGLQALRAANLIEACGVLNCRQLYVLCDKKVYYEMKGTI